MAWSDADKQLVADKLMEGLTASQIAAFLPGRTRNAVIGMVSRDKMLKAIGFTRKSGQNHGCGKYQQRGEKPKRRNLPRAASARIRNLGVVFKLPEPKVPVIPVAPIRPGQPQIAGQPLSMLAPRRCRFAVNEAARHEPHLFCGLPADGMYCEHHRRLAYQPARLRERANQRAAA